MSASKKEEESAAAAVTADAALEDDEFEEFPKEGATHYISNSTLQHNCISLFFSISALHHRLIGIPPVFGNHTHHQDFPVHYICF